MLGPCSAVTAGGKSEPSDYTVFNKYSGKVICNNVDGYYTYDNRAISTQDPRAPFAQTSEHVQVYGTYPDINTVPETGVVGADTLPRFIRVADPLDANRKAYLMRLTQGDPETSSSHRVEISAATPLPRGDNVWIGIGFLTPSSWKSVDDVLVGNPGGSSDQTLVWQMHDVGDVWDTAGQNPNLSMILIGGGSGTPERSKLVLTARTSTNPVTIKAEYQTRTMFEETDYPADVWQYWIFNVRLHWDSSYSPYFKAWRRVGYTGEWKQLVDDNLPNQFNNVPNDYQKQGIYYYVDAWTGGITSRVLYSKGLHSFKDDGSITLEDMQDFMDKI